jgi:predicted nucleic acid-binding protein
LPTPENETLIVVNTTPVIALSITRQLHLLRDLYREVAIPPAVHAEEVQREGIRLSASLIAEALRLAGEP